MNPADDLKVCPECGRRTLLAYTFPNRVEKDCINPECDYAKVFFKPVDVRRFVFPLGALENGMVSQ